MEPFLPLTIFFNRIADDARINTTHISLYISLLQQWTVTEGHNPFPIVRDTIMKMAKISSRATYNKGMNHLQEFGYIRYLPSSNSFSQSTIYLRGIEKQLPWKTLSS